jgi:hypothetical protein
MHACMLLHVCNCNVLEIAKNKKTTNINKILVDTDTKATFKTNQKYAGKGVYVLTGLAIS